MSDFHCEFSAEDFTATAFTSSTGRVVRVSGFGLCPSGGWELVLAPTNQGVAPHPESLWLELRERAPRRSKGRALVDTAVEAIIEHDRATEIVVRFSWREPIVIPVLEFDPFGARRADAAGRAAAASVTS